MQNLKEKEISCVNKLTGSLSWYHIKVVVSIDLKLINLKPALLKTQSCFKLMFQFSILNSHRIYRPTKCIEFVKLVIFD